VLVGPTSIPRD
jgi:hypothetical protein